MPHQFNHSTQRGRGLLGARRGGDSGGRDDGPAAEEAEAASGGRRLETVAWQRDTPLFNLCAAEINVHLCKTERRSEAQRGHTHFDR